MEYVSIEKLNKIIELLSDNALGTYGYLTTVLSSLFIFNFASLFILAQENFHKFNSVKLLKILISPALIFFTIIIPVFFIIFSILNFIPIIHRKLFCICGIMYGIGSSCYLLNRLHKYLDITYMIKNIIARTTINDFHDYKHNNFMNTDNNFDTLLKLITGAIDRNDDFDTKSIFNYTFSWLSTNLEQIRSSSTIVWYIQNNGFNLFFDIIVSKIIQKDSYIIKKIYINSIYDNFLLTVDINNLENYRYPILSLKRLACDAIEKTNNVNNEVANKIFSVILNSFNNILYKLDYGKYSDSFFINKSTSYKNFEEIILKPILEIFKSAITAHNSDFFSGIFFTSKIFPSFDINDLLKWNINYLSCYQEIRYTYKEILKTNSYNPTVVRFVIREYKDISTNISCQDANRTVVKHFFNGFMKDLFDIYIDLLDNNIELRPSDFEIFYSFFWKEQIDVYQCQYYLEVFGKIIDKYFEIQINQNNITWNYVYRLWERVEQILLHFEKEKRKETFYHYWEKTVKDLSKKYKILISGYKKWEDDFKKGIEKFKSAIENIEYID